MHTGWVRLLSSVRNQKHNWITSDNGDNGSLFSVKARKTENGLSNQITRAHRECSVSQNLGHLQLHFSLQPCQQQAPISPTLALHRCANTATVNFCFHLFHHVNSTHFFLNVSSLIEHLYCVIASAFWLLSVLSNEHFRQKN